MDAELKFIDSAAVTVSPVPTGGTVQLLNGVGNGTDYTNRIGRKTWNVEAVIYVNVNSTATSAPIGDSVRTMVIVDNQPSGALPSLGDILATADITAPRNMDNRARFEFLYDRVTDCEAGTYTTGTLTAGSPQQHTTRINLELNLESIYSTNTTTIASISSGAVYLVFVSATGLYRVIYNSRIIFLDS